MAMVFREYLKKALRSVKEAEAKREERFEAADKVA